MALSNLEAYAAQWPELAYLRGCTVICIVGSTVFTCPDSEVLIATLAADLDDSLGSKSVFVTGGMPGVQHTFAQAACYGNRVFAMVPEGFEQSEQGAQIPHVGTIIHAGADLEARKEIFSQIGHIYITCEGGPGAAKEAAHAYARGAKVVPLIRTGGASGGMFNFPTEAFQNPEPAYISESRWAALSNESIQVEHTAQACSTVVNALACAMEGAMLDDRIKEIEVLKQTIAEQARMVEGRFHSLEREDPHATAARTLERVGMHEQTGRGGSGGSGLEARVVEAEAMKNEIELKTKHLEERVANMGLGKATTSRDIVTGDKGDLEQHKVALEARAMDLVRRMNALECTASPDAHQAASDQISHERLHKLEDMRLDMGTMVEDLNGRISKLEIMPNGEGATGGQAYTALEAKLKGVEAKRAEIETLARGLQLRVSTLEASGGNAMATLAPADPSFDERWKRVEVQKAELERRATHLEAELASLAMAPQPMQYDTSPDNGQGQAQMQELQNELNMLREHLYLEQNESKSLLDKIQMLEQASAKAEGEAHIAEERAAEYERHCQQLQAQAAEGQQGGEAAWQQLQIAQQEKQVAVQEADEAFQAAEAARQQIQIAQQEQQIAVQEVQRMQRQLEEASKLTQANEGIPAGYEQEYANLMQDNANKELQLAQHRDQVSQWTTEQEGNQRLFEEMQFKHDCLLQDHEALRGQHSYAEEELQKQAEAKRLLESDYAEAQRQLAVAQALAQARQHVQAHAPAAPVPVRKTSGFPSKSFVAEPDLSASYNSGHFTPWEPTKPTASVMPIRRTPVVSGMAGSMQGQGRIVQNNEISSSRVDMNDKVTKGEFIAPMVGSYSAQFLPKVTSVSPSLASPTYQPTSYKTTALANPSAYMPPTYPAYGNPRSPGAAMPTMSQLAAVPQGVVSAPNRPVAWPHAVSGNYPYPSRTTP